MEEGLSIIKDLPADMVFEILLGLPVKSLVRFKSVCKSWYGLIGSNEFKLMQLNRSHRNINKQGILIECFKSYPKYRMISNDGSDQYLGISAVRSLKLVAHCDGIIFESSLTEDDCFLHNLAIRETFPLPKSNVLSHHPDPPIRSRFCAVGFGYDLRTHRYKAVRISRTQSNTPGLSCKIIEVYTLGSNNSWRQVRDDHNGMFINSLNSRQITGFNGVGFYFNGAIHWPARSLRPHEDGKKKNGFMALFNLGDEEFQRIRLPYDADQRFYGFLVSDGSQLAVCLRRGTLLHIFVYDHVVEEPNWTKVLTIKCGDYILPYPLPIWKNNEILFQVLDRDQRKLAFYDLEKQEFKNVQILQRTHLILLTASGAYMDSLVSINQ